MNLFSFCRTEAFHSQLEKFRPRLYRVAYAWSHNAMLADDLVQETLAKALQNASQLKNPQSMHSWLFAILANCWRDHFRRHREMDDIDEIEDYRCMDERTPEQEHAQSQLVSRVRLAIASLPLKHRQVLTLVDLEELSYTAVATILEIPAGTVMSRLCRAREALRKQLQEFSPNEAAKILNIRRA